MHLLYSYNAYICFAYHDGDTVHLYVVIPVWVSELVRLFLLNVLVLVIPVILPCYVWDFLLLPDKPRSAMLMVLRSLLLFSQDRVALMTLTLTLYGPPLLGSFQHLLNTLRYTWSPGSNPLGGSCSELVFLLLENKRMYDI